MGRRRVLKDDVVKRFRPYLPLQVFDHLSESDEGIPSERRLVTVIFADISGFTSMSEHLDPEEVAEFTNRILNALATPVTARDGMVDKFIGDAMMAVFGAPISHHDDTRRAFEAALDMIQGVREASNGALRVSIGIHTGLAISGTVGGGGRKSYTVLGDTVNTTARIETLAEPNQILVSEEAEIAAGPAFIYGKMKTAKVKGREVPVRVKPLISLNKKIVPAKWVYKPVFIGRKKALKELAAVVHRQGWVMVTGVAGIGKTTLIRQFCAKHKKKKDMIRIDGRQISGDKHFSLIRTILANVQARSRSPKFKKHVENLIQETKTKNANSKGFLKDLKLLLKKKKYIVVIEDLHYVDESSRIILAQLMDVEGLSCVVTTRPYTDILEQLYRLEQLPVGALEPDEICEHIKKLLGTKVLPRGVSKLAEKIGGLPLAVEETIRSFVRQGHLYQVKTKSGKKQWRLWPKACGDNALATIIRSRLDSLTPMSRALISKLSIFAVAAPWPFPGDSAESTREQEAALIAAVQAGVIVREGKEVSFFHDLFRKVAYETILKSKRKEYHIKVADSLDESNATSAELGRHFYLGKEYHRALPFLIIAADDAVTVKANDTARRLLANARFCAEETGDQTQLAEVLLRIAAVHLRTSKHQKAKETLDLSREIVSKISNKKLTLTQLQRDATYSKNVGEIKKMIALCTTIIKKSKADSTARANAYQTLGAQAWRDGRYIDATKMYEKILAMNNTDARSTVVSASSLIDLYRMTKKFEKAEKLMPIVMIDRYAGWPLLHRGRLLLARGDLKNAEKDFREALSRAKKNEDMRLGILTLRDLGRCQLRMGRNEEGIAHFHSALQLVDKVPAFAARAYAESALVFAKLGRINHAQRLMKRAEEANKRIYLLETEIVLLETKIALASSKKSGVKREKLVRKWLALRKSMGVPVTRADLEKM